MAEFWTRCSKVLNQVADINLYKEYKSLANDDVRSLLCEGCGYIGISKDEKGRMHLIFTRDGKNVEEPYSDFPSDK